MPEEPRVIDLSAQSKKARKKAKKGGKTPEKIAKVAANLEAHRLIQLAALERRGIARERNLAIMRERWPAAFNDARPVPLALKAGREVRLALGLTVSATKDALGWWTTRPAYYESLAAGGARFELDGSAGTDQVDPDTQENAAKIVRLARKAERRWAVAA